VIYSLSWYLPLDPPVVLPLTSSLVSFFWARQLLLSEGNVQDKKNDRSLKRVFVLVVFGEIVSSITEEPVG
jgi:hypothetical protein